VSIAAIFCYVQKYRGRPGERAVMADSSIGNIPMQNAVVRDRAAEFRRVMGRFPTGVVVVAALHHGRPYGMSVNSFASVSLDPLMLMFCAARDSSTWPYLRKAGRFAVSVLGADQEQACRLFATKGVDRFAALPWSLNASGQPVLDDAIAWFDCVLADVFPGGDHEIVLGRVLDVRERADGNPLVFHRGTFTGLPVNGAGKA
jgi:3-hydroxy-9,10-secoandrosta-1,3,5(10)-triene-9,17-dione monooxygenase reductase component